MPLTKYSKILRRSNLFRALAYPLFLAALASCSGPEKTQQRPQPAPQKPPLTKKAPAPDITITVASINIKHYGKRIEREDIDKLASAIHKLKVDIVCVEGIARYPGIPERVDVVDELSNAASLREAFGEEISLSGRQTGNAVFSVYPIQSSENTHYTGLPPSSFETAFQAMVDCGARDVVVVSTLLPDKASLDEQSTCANLLGSFSTFYINHPIIITGNLPRFETLRKMEQYREAVVPKPADATRFWYSGDGSLTLEKVAAEPTSLGPLVVAQFGIFRQSQP